MGKLTTHVLDTANGRPGAGIAILLREVGSKGDLARAVTNADGRTDAPLLDADQYAPGTYELTFSIGDYFATISGDANAPRFLDEVVIRFTAAADEHYHVPLLVSPFAYSTYRGS